MLRNHYSDPDRLLEFRQPSYINPAPNIRVHSHVMPPSQNPLIMQQRAHDLAIGSKAAQAGQPKSKPNILASMIQYEKVM